MKGIDRKWRRRVVVGVVVLVCGLMLHGMALRGLACLLVESLQRVEGMSFWWWEEIGALRKQGRRFARG